LKVLFVFGTRPEAIKLAPLVKAMEKTGRFEVETCITAQHREMLDQVIDLFQITPTYDLNLMRPGQSLFGITAKIMEAMEGVLDQSAPDYVIVQGDTTTAFCGALAAYYKQIKVGHIEAGLRTDNKYSPFPEEVNRSLIGRIADHHFAPTQLAADNLTRENIDPKSVHIVGNTVIDALFLTLDIINSGGEDGFQETFNFLNFEKRIILITGHRRESFGTPFQNIFEAIKKLATRYSDVEFVYPVHLNPNIQNHVGGILGDQSNVHLIDPLPYPQLVWLMSKCHLVLTDSGGIQEEAPSLGKPVLVTREVTERPEGIEAGVSRIVSTKQSTIISAVTELLESTEAYGRMSNAQNPYGDGSSCQQIIDIIEA